MDLSRITLPMLPDGLDATSVYLGVYDAGRLYHTSVSCAQMFDRSTPARYRQVSVADFVGRACSSCGTNSLAASPEAQFVFTLAQRIDHVRRLVKGLSTEGPYDATYSRPEMLYPPLVTALVNLKFQATACASLGASAIDIVLDSLPEHLLPELKAYAEATALLQVFAKRSEDFEPLLEKLATRHMGPLPATRVPAVLRTLTTWASANRDTLGEVLSLSLGPYLTALFMDEVANTILGPPSAQGDWVLVEISTDPDLGLLKQSEALFLARAFASGSHNSLLLVPAWCAPLFDRTAPVDIAGYSDEEVARLLDLCLSYRSVTMPLDDSWDCACMTM